MHISKLVSFNPSYEADGKGGGGTGDGDKGEATPPDSISKTEHDKQIGELKQNLEDMRLEIMTPEYIAFLEAQGSTKKEDPPKPEDKSDLSKLTPDQIYQKARTDAAAEAKAEIDKLRNEFSTKDRDAITKEVAAFARKTPDYERYRPLMYGLSRDPKNADLSLQELYDKAREHAKSFGPTEEDKRRSRNSNSEKPGGSSGTHGKDKKYTPEEAALEAWNEVVGDEGLPKT